MQRVGVGEQQRALPEVVQQQAGKDKAQPAATDRRPPEMPHIGIERLGASDRENDGAEQNKARARVAEDQLNPVERVDCLEDPRLPDDLGETQQTERREPDDDDRAEKHADPLGAAALRDKQRDQQHERQG